MRVKLFHGSGWKEEDLRELQAKINAWLRRLGRHPEFRVVAQNLQCFYQGSSCEDAVAIAAVWYEKVRKEADA